MHSELLPTSKSLSVEKAMSYSAKTHGLPYNLYQRPTCHPAPQSPSFAYSRTDERAFAAALEGKIRCRNGKGQQSLLHFLAKGNNERHSEIK